MRFTLAIVIAALVALIAVSSVADAHKSVKYHKPKTEEDREMHHQMMRSRPAPESQFGDVEFKRAKAAENGELDQSKKPHHLRWGPRYPNHLKLKNWHYPPPRTYKGSIIPPEIHEDHLHLFGHSKFQTL